MESILSLAFKELATLRRTLVPSRKKQRVTILLE